MNKSIHEIKITARRQLSGTGVSSTALTLMVIGLPLLGYLLYKNYSLIIFGILFAPIHLGVWIYFLRSVRTYKVPHKNNKNTDFTVITPWRMVYSTSNPNALQTNASVMFLGFKYFFAAIKLFLLYLVKVVAWSCLLIIPGILKIYSYRLCFIILADNPEIGAKKSLYLSEKMMTGHRLKLFLLDISFVGWIIFSIVTFLVGTVISFPYIMATNAIFYEELKHHCIENKIIEESDIISKSSWDY